MNVLNGSQIRIIHSLSAVVMGEAGSSDPINLGGYQGGMVIAAYTSSASNSAGGTLVSVLRSSTSNGSFNGFGASLPGVGTNNRVQSRSFIVNTSATWHRVFYNNGTGGSFNTTILMLAHLPRSEPVTLQETGVSIFSDVV